MSTRSPFAHTWERHWTGWQRIRLFCVDGMQAPRRCKVLSAGKHSRWNGIFVRRILSGEGVGDWSSIIDLQVNAAQGATAYPGAPAEVVRGSATNYPGAAETMDAVATDPLYYDISICRHFRLLLRLVKAFDWRSLFGSLRITSHSQETRSDCHPYRHGGSNERPGSRTSR